VICFPSVFAEINSFLSKFGDEHISRNIIHRARFPQAIPSRTVLRLIWDIHHDPVPACADSDHSTEGLTMLRIFRSAERNG